MDVMQVQSFVPPTPEFRPGRWVDGIFSLAAMAASVAAS